MKRWIKVLSVIVGALFIAAFLLWIGIAVYVNSNKKALLMAITKQLNENINGTLTVESMEPTLIKGFPAISVSLSHVLLRDTMYPVHHHNLLQAKKMSISVNAFSILRGAPRIRDIHIEDGSVYLFTDSLGYSNTNLFVQKSIRDSSGKKPAPRLNHFFFDRVHFVFEHKANKKLFDFKIDHLEGRFDYRDTGWQAVVRLNMLVNALDFYNPNGPFLKHKRVQARLQANFSNSRQVLDIPVSTFSIEKHDVSIGASVFLGSQPTVFMVEIKAVGMDFRDGRSMLSDHISEKLERIELKKPFDIQVSISGKDQKRDQPVVYARWQVNSNILEGQGTRIDHCNFTGYFYNRVNVKQAVCDENSVIALEHFTGSWEDIDFSADNIRIHNLISPVLEGRFRSDFDIRKLNPILDNQTFKMGKGSVSLDLLFKGGIKNNDTTQPYILGKVEIRDAAITYLPRNLLFSHTHAELDFRGNDLLIKNIRLQNGDNVLTMNGSMRNLLNLYYTDPEKIRLDWHVSSPEINLDQYKKFLELRKTPVRATSGQRLKQPGSVSRFARQLDQILEKSSVELRLDVDRLSYRKFTANHIVAAVKLNREGILLQRVSVQHGGGTLEMSGQLIQTGKTNRFAVNATVERVRINEFLHAFGNFGQNTVTDQNIKGDIFLQANVSGLVKDDGMLVPSSMKGTAVFELKNGVLTDFAPLKNIGRFVFRRRDCSNIRIISLKDKFEINGDQIRIHPLKLSSEVINADVEGIYSYGTGTDIDVDIPMRNPKNDELELNETLRQKKRNKGLVVHLNVSDRDDGKMKIRLVGKALPGSVPAAGEPEPERKKRKNLLGL